MKILHTADLHLGRPFNGLSLEAHHQAVLDQIAQAILHHRPEVFIIAGDIFDRPSPPVSAVRQFNAFLKQVAAETGVAVVMIAGNHDSGDRFGAMSAFADTARALIRGPLLAEELPLILHDAHGPVAISALPFGYEYAARECFADPAIATPEDVVRTQLSAARRHVPDGARWVVVAHAFVAGASSSEGERSLVRVGGIETVPSEVFAGAHYVALGHLHRAQTAGAAHIRYSGAPLAFGFDEAGEPKSMTLVELDAAGTAGISTIPFMPPRGVRVLHGKLADLLLAPPSTDFVKVVLADQERLIEPMKQLRALYPNICHLSYARDERAPDAKSAVQAGTRLNEPFEVIGDFLELVRGQRLSEPEARLAADVLHSLRHDEDAR